MPRLSPKPAVTKASGRFFKKNHRKKIYKPGLLRAAPPSPKRLKSFQTPPA
jgi:hypothetical protein